VDIFKHTAKKNKKIKRADQILPEVYGTTLNTYLANISNISSIKYPVKEQCYNKCWILYGDILIINRE
jgi:hypothetical protein